MLLINKAPCKAGRFYSTYYLCGTVSHLRRITSVIAIHSSDKISLVWLDLQNDNLRHEQYGAT